MYIYTIWRGLIFHEFKLKDKYDRSGFPSWVNELQYSTNICMDVIMSGLTLSKITLTILIIKTINYYNMKVALIQNVYMYNSTIVFPNLSTHLTYLFCFIWNYHSII